jgi:hypothetical protein
MFGFSLRTRGLVVLFMLGLGAVLLGSCSDWGGALTAISTACAAPEFLRSS